jgi:hypothetical protein
MALFRLTFFFEQQENGWSESIHTTATDTPTLISLVLGYAQRRMDFCHPSTFLTHVRVSDDQVFRDVILDPMTLPIKGNWKSLAKAEGPWTALDLRLQSGPLVQRSLFVRGIPAGQIDSNLPSFTADFDSAYGRWVTFLADSLFGIKNKDRTQAKQAINTVSVGGVVNMLAPLLGLANLDTVQVLGIPRSVLPKRTYTVQNFVDMSNFTLRGYNGPAIAGRGFLRRISYVISPITATATDFATERRVGRPFGVLRGRRAVIR